MAITIQADKIAIQAILSTDEYITDYLGFDPKEIYKVRANDKLLEKGTKQIFIYNAFPEPTMSEIVWGVVYEIAVSVPWENSGTADLAIEQINSLLTNANLAINVKLEFLEGPVPLSSETSLYQVAMRYKAYESIYNKPKVRPKA